MRFFIVKDENAAYYYAKHKGICRRNLDSLRSGEEILPEASDGFALFRHRGTHIVCSDKNNDILYMNHPGKPHLLIPGHKDIVPYDFSLTMIGERLNLFYKTDYNDKILLYHCILGNMQKPYTIAELSPDSTHYYCGYGKLFYTSAEGILCGVVPQNGTKRVTDMYEGGSMPSFASYDGKDLLVYIKSGKVYLNKQPMAEDKYAEQPIVFTFKNATYIQWKSGNFIKYKRLENDKWSDTVQYIGADSMPHIINTVIGTNNFPCYGYNGRPSIKM